MPLLLEDMNSRLDDRGSQVIPVRSLSSDFVRSPSVRCGVVSPHSAAKNAEESLTQKKQDSREHRANPKTFILISECLMYWER